MKYREGNLYGSKLGNGLSNGSEYDYDILFSKKAIG